MQEVALLSGLQHPCIVEYRDSFIQDGNLHIVQQVRQPPPTGHVRPACPADALRERRRRVARPPPLQSYARSSPAVLRRRRPRQPHQGGPEGAVVVRGGASPRLVCAAVHGGACARVRRAPRASFARAARALPAATGRDVRTAWVFPDARTPAQVAYVHARRVLHRDLKTQVRGAGAAFARRSMTRRLTARPVCPPARRPPGRAERVPYAPEHGPARRLWDCARARAHVRVRARPGPFGRPRGRRAPHAGPHPARTHPRAGAPRRSSARRTL